MKAKTCTQCGTSFEINESEASLRKKASPVILGTLYEFPEPSFCPPCRRQRRYCFRNDKNLYKRKCDKTGKMILSVFDEKVVFPVYSQEAWWADDWSPCDFGRDYDFGRPFFEQFADLQKVVPRLSSVVVQSENCDYTGFCFQSRNCYLSFRLANNEDIYYSYLALNSNTCFDNYNIDYCELCYECIDCKHCYQCFYTERSMNSNNLIFCADMTGCKDCFGCVGLVQKQYHFFNESLSKEEYNEKIAEVWDGSPESIAKIRARFDELVKESPVRATQVINSENVFGSYIFDSKNIFNSFDIVHCEDAVHCTQDEYSNDILDTDFAYECNVMLEQVSGGDSRQSAFCFVSIGGSSDTLYSMESYNGTQYVFGCIGMKKAKYCILNKQYTKEEYEELLPKIIEHMKSTGEWGEYFPMKLSPFAYNETTAFGFFPLEKETVLERGGKWLDKIEGTPEAEGVNVLNCEITGRPFRLVQQEIDFYNRMKIPVPRRHPDIRHQDRLKRRNPYQLRGTSCNKCNKSIWTDCPSDERQIYCHDCYRALVY